MPILGDKIVVPEGAEALRQPGFHMYAQRKDDYGTKGWLFWLYGPKGRKRVADVNEPLTKTYRSIDDMPDEAVIRPLISSTGLAEDETRALAEVLVTAANMAAHLNEANAAALAKQRERYEKHQQALRLRNQFDEEQFQKLYQQLIWLIESKFRLKRRGMKATVFGTIKSVTPPNEDGTGPRWAVMETISEKDIRMTIRVKDIIWMDIKEDPSSRRYTNIYTEEVKS